MREYFKNVKGEELELYRGTLLGILVLTLMSIIGIFSVNMLLGVVVGSLWITLNLANIKTKDTKDIKEQ